MKGHKGMTLVEMMVAFGIFLMIASLIVSVTGTGRMSWTSLAARIYLKTQAQRVISSLTNELSQTDRAIQYSSIPSEDNGRSIRFSIPTINSSGALLLSTSGSIQWGDGTPVGTGNSIRYRFNTTSFQLAREILGPLPSLARIDQQTVASDMTYFNVTYNSTRSVYEVAFRFRADRFAGSQVPTIYYPPQRNIGSAGTPIIVDTNITVSIRPAN